MDAHNLVQVILQTGILKTVPRSGWARIGVRKPESVSDHSYRVAIIAMLVAPTLKLDQLKLVKMALVHDLGEALVGDIIWEKGKKVIGSQVEKHKDEKKAVSSIFHNEKIEYLQLWGEFEEQKTKEAQVLKQIDKLEMVIQAYEYEKSGYPRADLDEFWQNAEKYLVGKELEGVFRKILKMRQGL